MKFMIEKMKKSPIEIVRLNPVHKEKIDSKSARLLRNKLYQLSKESINNELPSNYKKEDTKNIQLRSNRKSIAVPPLPNVGSEGLLPLQVCNWLIYSHLLRWNYRCTIASFQSESHVSGSPENIFTVYDILDLLGISKDSIFYTNFLAEYNEMENKGMLYTLLKHCIKHRIMKSSTDVAIQVNNVEKVKSIAEKLKEIDEVFKEKQQKLQEISSGSQNNKAKNTVENNEMLQIERKIEIENIKKREKMIYQSELENAKSRIKKEYEARLEMLQQKQIEYQNEMQKKRELEQQEINRLKEQFIQELDNLQKYEEVTKREMEHRRNQLDVEANMLLEKKNGLQMKEYEIEKRRIEAVAMNEEISNSIHKSSALKVEQKLIELRSWEEKLRSETERLQEERQQASKKANEADDLKPKLYELELSLKSLQDKYCAIVKQNTKLSNKLDSMVDYNSVKAELCYTKKELETVKEHLSDTRKEALYAAKSNIQHLREQRSPEGREAYHLPSVDTSYQILLQEQCKRLEKEIEELHRLNKKIIVRNDQQQQEIEGLKRTVHSFEMHLYYSQNKFSDVKVKEDKNPIPPLSNVKQVAAPMPLWENRTHDSIHSFNPSTPRKHTALGFSPTVQYPLKRAHSFDKEKPLRFITEARKRIDYLQIEAEALEKKYGEYLQSQANLFWTIPTSINTLFPGAEHSPLSQNVHKIGKTYSTIHSLKSKFYTQSLHPFPVLKTSSKIIPTSNYSTISSISKPLGETRLHLAESTHVSIHQERPKSKSESSTMEKNKFILGPQLSHKTESLCNKESKKELIDSPRKALMDKSYEDTFKPSSEVKETSEAKESMHSKNSKEFPVCKSKIPTVNISGAKKDSHDTDLEHSSGNSKSLKILDKDHIMKSEDANLSNFSRTVSREENSYPDEVENDSLHDAVGNASLHHVSTSIQSPNHSEVQNKLSLLDKLEEKPLVNNIGLFHQDSSSEKHSLKEDHVEKYVSPSEEHSLKGNHVEKDVSLSQKHSSKRSNIEENVSSSESYNRNVHTLPSVASNGEKIQEAPDKNVLQEHGIGDALDVNILKEIDHVTAINKVALPENDNHSTSSKKGQNGNSSSHKTDAPEISEISISAGSVGHLSKGSVESDFW